MNYTDVSKKEDDGKNVLGDYVSALLTVTAVNLSVPSWSAGGLVETLC